MKVKEGARAFRLLQLVAAGAVIGLYAVKAAGFAGFEPSLGVETVGASAGAVTVLLLKLLHFV